MSMPSIFVVIPAYNEGSAIEAVVRGVLPYCSRVVVVDDGSSDDTAEHAWKAGADVLRHTVNLGQGAGLQTGMEYALAEGAEYIVTFDADGQHSPEDIAVGLQALKQHQADIALGSRFLGKAVNMPKRKYWTLKAGILFTWITAGVRLTDTHNGFRVLTREGARRVQLTQNRMAHASEFIEIIHRERIPYVEIPVTITYTAYSMHKGQKLSNIFPILGDLLSRRFL